MISLHIPNMNCGGCARGVSAAILEVDSMAKVELDLQQKTVAIDTTAPEALLRKALSNAGFAAV